MNNGTELIKLHTANQAIIEAMPLTELIERNSESVAVLAWVKAQKLGIKMQNNVAETKIRIERQIGKFLIESERLKGRPAKKVSHNVTLSSLNDLGLNRMQSVRYRKEASVPEKQFEQHVAETKEKEEELTSASIMRIADKKGHKPTPVVALPKGKYDLIYCDPPWRYEFPVSESRKIENQYPTLSSQELFDIAIPAADKSILLLWATAPKLEEALQIMNAWGFLYRSCAIWDKEKMGMGYWFRIQHELLLVGIKGNFSPPIATNRIRSIIRSPRKGHSEKPDVFYVIIESLFPDTKKIELFSRKKRKGWDRWGNE